MRSINKVFGITLLSLLLLPLAGCFTNFTKSRGGISSSLVDYLYPNGGPPATTSDEPPTLNIPLRVGLAFVPSTQEHDSHMNQDGISEVDQLQLLEKIKTAFAQETYIKEITVIPTSYLRSGKGFDTLEQVGRLYGVDVMALVSYDQLAIAEDNKASLFYWTIVGAYTIKGSDNSIQTFVDTAIFDLTTHKLLLRAPGVDRRESTSTLVNADETIRRNRRASFEHAVDNMNQNLAVELDRFKDRIKTDGIAKVNYRGSGGGGVWSWFLTAVLLGFVGTRMICANFNSRV